MTQIRSGRQLDQVATSLAGLARKSGTTNQFYTGRVTAYRSDGAVNLVVNGRQLFGIPCLDAYQGRAADDIVQVGRIGNLWLVLGRVGADPYAFTGNNPPTATSSFIGTMPSGGGGGVVAQGCSGLGGDTAQATAAWFYGTALNAACAATGTSTLNITFSRHTLAYGQPQAQTVYLYPHIYPSVAAAVSAGFAAYTSGSFAAPLRFTLEQGETTTITLPTIWFNGFKAGTFLGVCAGGPQLQVQPAGQDYVVFDQDSGFFNVE